MTDDERIHLLELVSVARSKLTALKSAIVHAAGPSEAPEAPLSRPEPVPRAVVHIGTASAEKGKEAALEVRLTCPEPLAGVWLNIRHSPRLKALSATSKVKSRAFRFEPAADHARALLMFSTDLETESSTPGTGLVQLAPETLILVCTYRVQADAPLGRLPVQAGRSGAATPGVSRVSWPTLLLNWGSGGITPAVEDGYVEVIA